VNAYRPLAIREMRGAPGPLEPILHHAPAHSGRFLRPKRKPMMKTTELTAQSWLENHAGKLQGYSRALANRFPTPTFDYDDIFQMMSLKIWRLALADPAFLEKGDAYLLKVCWNAGLQMLRSERRYSRHIEIPAANNNEAEPIELPDSAPCPERLAITAQEVEALAQAILALPERARQICKMLYAGKRPFEVARELRVSRAYISQSKNYIRGKLEQTGIYA
jgi:RNA polymerase sigma factor (sigma-70 family)